MLARSATAFLAATLLLPTLTPAGPRDRMLVSARWLAEHLRDPNLVLLEVGNRADYEKAHIPGARYLSLGSITEQAPNGIAFELPNATRLDSVLASYGVTRDSRIVLYFGTDWVSPTTRAWFTFDYLGLGERTSILDGGLPAWREAGLPLAADVPPPATVAPLSLPPRAAVVATAQWIQERLGKPGFRIVDARIWEFYRGLDAGSGSRPGHLPGARSIPFNTLFDDANRFLPDSALRRLFQGAGIAKGDQIVAYCHIGQQATAVVFAARLLGYNVRLYDGSFQDWSRRDELTVEGGVPFTKGTLVSTEALAPRLEAGDVTIVDLRSDLPAYLANHLPRAVYLHYETLRASRAGIPGDILTPEAYAELWSRLGIRRGRPVVIYGSGDAQNFNATFLAWLLAGFRQEEVYLLDGGYAKWAAEGRPLSRLYPEIATVKYSVDPYRLDRVEGEHVHHALNWDGAVIVDVRPPDQYAGSAGAQLRRGHIPKAINHFWRDDLVTAQGATVWKPVDELRSAYAAQGITPDKYVIVYCNTGTEASHAYFALRFLLAYPKVEVYVPSWTEWSAHTEWPVEGPATAETH